MMEYICFCCNFIARFVLFVAFLCILNKLQSLMLYLYLVIFTYVHMFLSLFSLDLYFAFMCILNKFPSLLLYLYSLIIIPGNTYT
jgi:hypothetical protein